MSTRIFSHPRTDSRCVTTRRDDGPPTRSYPSRPTRDSTRAYYAAERQKRPQPSALSAFRKRDSSNSSSTLRRVSQEAHMRDDASTRDDPTTNGDQPATLTAYTDVWPPLPDNVTVARRSTSRPTIPATSLNPSRRATTAKPPTLRRHQAQTGHAAPRAPCTPPALPHPRRSNEVPRRRCGQTSTSSRAERTRRARALPPEAGHTGGGGQAFVE